MAIALLVIFILLPVLELLVLFKIGGWIGVLPLLALLAATAIAGGLLLRRQGLAAMRRALEQMARDEPPVQAMIDGIGLSLAGVLFILPGLISDVLGLLLLVPPLRRWLVLLLLGQAVWRWDVRGRAEEGGPRRSGPRDDAGTGRGNSPHQPGVPRDSQVIEGEFERLDERTIRPGQAQPGPSGRPDDPQNPGQNSKPTSPWRK